MRCTVMAVFLKRSTSSKSWEAYSVAAADPGLTITIATWQSHNNDNSIAFFNKPRLRLLKVTCLRGHASSGTHLLRATGVLVCWPRASGDTCIGVNNYLFNNQPVPWYME
jgi:hypothetical protein